MISWFIIVLVTLFYGLLAIMFMLDGDTMGAGVMLLSAVCFNMIAWKEFAK